MLPDALGVRLNIGGYACNLGLRRYALFPMSDMKKAIALNNPDRSDAIDVLAKVGGYDICGNYGSDRTADRNRKSKF